MSECEFFWKVWAHLLIWCCASTRMTHSGITVQSQLCKLLRQLIRASRWHAWVSASSPNDLYKYTHGAFGLVVSLFTFTPKKDPLQGSVGANSFLKSSAQLFCPVFWSFGRNTPDFKTAAPIEKFNLGCIAADFCCFTGCFSMASGMNDYREEVVCHGELDSVRKTDNWRVL